MCSVRTHHLVPFAPTTPSPPAAPSLQCPPCSCSPRPLRSPLRTAVLATAPHRRGGVCPSLPGAEHCAPHTTGTQILSKQMKAVDLLILNSFLSSVLYFFLPHFYNRDANIKVIIYTHLAKFLKAI